MTDSATQCLLRNTLHTVYRRRNQCSGVVKCTRRDMQVHSACSTIKNMINDKALGPADSLLQSNWRYSSIKCITETLVNKLKMQTV